MEIKLIAFRLVSIAMLYFLLFNSMIIITTNVEANEEPIQYPKWYRGGPYNPDAGEIVNFLANKIYKIIFGFNIGSGVAPKYFSASPQVITIDYLGNASTQIVWGNPKKPYHGFQTNVFSEMTFYYNVSFPDYIPESAFRYYFEPTTIDLEEYDKEMSSIYGDGGDANKQKPMPYSTLHIILDEPPDPNNPIQDFILSVNVTIVRKFTNMIETEAFGADPENPDLFDKISTALGSIGFLRVYSTSSVGQRSCQVFVKINPYRNATIYSSNPIQMKPDEKKTVSLRIQNRGSHVEQFGIRCTSNHKNLFVNTPGPVTIYPGQSRDINLGLVTKPIIYDHGTVNTVNLEVFPHDDPSSIIAITNITVICKGYNLGGVINFRTNPINIVYFSILSIIILIILIILNSKKTVYFKKPNKPWTIPKEKEYLTSLIKQHRHEDYRTAIIFMKLEYQSSMMWYKSYKKNYKH